LLSNSKYRLTPCYGKQFGYVRDCIAEAAKHPDCKDMYRDTLSELVKTGFALLDDTHPFAEIFTRSNVGGVVPPDAEVSPLFIPEEVICDQPGIAVSSHMMRLLIANALQPASAAKAE
jgi:hypothetical protein